MNYLDAKKILLRKEKNQGLDLTYLDQKYKSIHIYLAFPLQSTTKYISLWNEDDKEEIGMIEDITELDDISRKSIEEELKFRYYMPEIIKINKHNFKRNNCTFEAVTSAGLKTIIVNDLVYNIFTNPDKSVTIKDVEGNYYNINSYLNSNDKHIRIIKNYL